MANNNHDELLRETGKILAEQKGTNRHLEKLNSKVAKHEERIQDVEKQNIEIEKNVENNTKYTKQSGSIRQKWLDRLLLGIVVVITNLSVGVLVATGILNI